MTSGPAPAGPAAGPAFDAVVLAGGTGRRLGGAAKPEVTLHGRRLLDHALGATAGAGRVVVVAPPAVDVPAGVVRALEDPPHGGPVAGVAAGL
ncbi:NTP transferase domain-containing protein, partial [Georgenia subflava]